MDQVAAITPCMSFIGVDPEGHKFARPFAHTAAGP
jgi:hypothetical protein